MRNLHVLENTMQEWILNCNDHRQYSENQLIEYANLPFGEYYNVGEKNFEDENRLPPIIAMKFVGKWHEVCAAIKIINNDESGYRHIGIASGYYYATFIIYSAFFYKKKNFKSFFLLADWCSRLFFLLAATKNEKEMKRVMLDLKKLKEKNKIDSYYFKISIFTLSLIELMVTGDMKKALSHFDSVPRKFKDTTAAVKMYKKMVAAFKDKTTQGKWNNLIEESILLHQKESILYDCDDESFDYQSESWASIPYEVIGYVNLVADNFKVNIDFPENELGMICRKLVGKHIPMEFDSLCQSVLERAKKSFIITF